MREKLLNLIPRTLWSVYETEDATELCIWRQWMGRTWDVTRVEV